MPLVQTTATGRPVALIIPKAKKAAVRSSMRTCTLINFCSAAAKNAKDNGALRDPGEITTSVIPDSIIWRTTTRASEVELFTSIAPRFS